MADHLRKQIRTASAIAVTSLTTTGANVFKTRFYPQETANLPCLLVYTLEEETEPASMGNTGTLERTVTLAIEAVVKATETLDDTLDKICKEVEIALMADPTLGGLAKDSYIMSTEIDEDVVGEKPVGVARMEFNVIYLAVKNAPDTSK